jgi:hypothetical protein
MKRLSVWKVLWVWEWIGKELWRWRMRVLMEEWMIGEVFE